LKRRSWSKSLVKIVPLPLIGSHLSSFIFIIIALFYLLFTAVSPQSVNGVRAGLTDIVTPVLGVMTRPLQDAAAFVRNASGITEMQAENARLVEENAKLREWYQAALLLDAENKSLRELLNVKLDPQNRYITARVLGDSGNTFVKSLLISAGENDGVRKGQAVISGVGLVGRVIEAGKNSARVLLVTDINSRVPIMVEDSRQHAIMAGSNDNRPGLAHIPPDSEIAAGARIVTSGHGGVFPQGLPIGRVVIDESSTYRVELFADFNKLVHIRVVDRPQDPNLHEASSGQLR
jgi:rod shape-determining protein MreC